MQRTEYLGPHPPIWHDGPDIPIIGSNGMGVFGFYLGLLMLVPGYGLAMLIIGGTDSVQGAKPGSELDFTVSSFVLGMIGMAVLMGGFFAWIASEPQVQAFTFDSNRQVLTLTVTRRGRKPREVSVPFGDILSIRPIVVSDSDKHGHFRVVYQEPNGKVYQHALADGTCMEGLAFHAAWLQEWVGERMQALLNLDK